MIRNVSWGGYRVPVPPDHGRVRTRLPVRHGQIVAAQVAVVVAVAGGGRPWAVLAGGVLLAAAFARRRRRWLYEWLRSAAAMAARRGRAPAGTGTDALLALARPGVRLAAEGDGPDAALRDPYGVSAVLEVGEAVSGASRPVRVPTGGLPDLGAATHLLARGSAPPAGTDPPATSYRALTGGGVVTALRLLLVVRVPAGGDVAAAVRAVRQRLAPLALVPRGPDAVRRAVGEFGYRAPVHEGWTSVHAGGRRHVTYRITGPGGRPERLVPHLLALPAATTVVAAGPGAVTVRTATDPPGEPRRIEAALARLLAGGPEVPLRLDGGHLPGMAATLPVPDPYAVPGRSGPVVPVGPAGLMLGRDRHGSRVLLPLFGPRPVRVVLAGGLALAVLLAWRGLGAGARVVVHTGRPAAWTPLVRAAAGCPPVLVEPGRTPAAATGAAATGAAATVPDPPVLHLMDAGHRTADPPGDHWHAVVTLRERPGAGDVGRLARADLVLAGPLDDRSATLVSAALGLGRRAGQLRETGAEELVTVCRGEIHRSRSCPTPAERALLAALEVHTGR
jgi:type VII secretion protein EccE